MLSFSDSAFWINLMNLALGASVIGCILMVLVDLLRDMSDHRRAHPHEHPVLRRIAVFMHDHWAHHHRH